MTDKKLQSVPARLAAVALALAFVSLVALFASGCGGSTPSGAIQSYYNALASGNWTAYQKALIPGQTLSKDQLELAKQKFNQTKISFKDLKFQTAYDPKDKNKATVTTVAGKITYTADILGRKQTQTQDAAKMNPSERPVLDVKKVNGVWYVDKQLGS